MHLMKYLQPPEAAPEAVVEVTMLAHGAGVHQHVATRGDVVDEHRLVNVGCGSRVGFNDQVGSNEVVHGSQGRSQ